MIHINLFPYRETQRMRTLRTLFTVWIVTVILGCLILLGVDSALLDTIQNLQTIQGKNTQTIGNLNEKLGEIKDIHKKKRWVQARLEIIRRLSIERTIPVLILNEITQTIPKHVWLTRVASQKDQLTLDGLAMSSAVVADFMQQLGTSPYFTNIELSKILQQDNPKGGKIKTFSLSLTFAAPKTADEQRTPGE